MNVLTFGSIWSHFQNIKHLEFACRTDMWNNFSFFQQIWFGSSHFSSNQYLNEWGKNLRGKIFLTLAGGLFENHSQKFRVYLVMIQSLLFKKTPRQHGRSTPIVLSLASSNIKKNLLPKYENLLSRNRDSPRLMEFG